MRAKRFCEPGVKVKSEYARAKAYVTKDGSLIRELMHPQFGHCSNQSIAEATIEPGCVTLLHRHRLSEEIYLVIEGEAIMTLGETQFPITKGDSVCIPPDVAHAVQNTGASPLRILCCCAPAYSHEDTELLEPQAAP